MVAVVKEFYRQFFPTYFFGQFFAEHRSPYRIGFCWIVGVRRVTNGDYLPIARWVVVNDNLNHRMRFVASLKGFGWKRSVMFYRRELLMREVGAGEAKFSWHFFERPSGTVGGVEWSGFVFPEYFFIERFFDDLPCDWRLRFGSLGELFEVRLRTVTEVRREQAGGDLNHHWHLSHLLEVRRPCRS